MKAGQGVKFLPNTMKSLRELGTLLEERIDMGSTYSDKNTAYSNARRTALT